MPIVRKNHDSSVQRRTTPSHSRVEPAREQRRDRECERNRRGDVAEIEIRRMDRHARILQLRIHPAPVERNEVEARERIRLEARRRDEEQQHRRDRARRPGHELAFPRRLVAMAIVPYIDRISAQNSIEPAWPLQNDVKMYTLGMFELMWLATYSSEKSLGQQRRPQPDRRREQSSRTSRRVRARRWRSDPSRRSRAAGERHGRRPGRHQQRDPERQLADENHARPAVFVWAAL